MMKMEIGIQISILNMHISRRNTPMLPKNSNNFSSIMCIPMLIHSDQVALKSATLFGAARIE